MRGSWANEALRRYGEDLSSPKTQAFLATEALNAQRDIVELEARHSSIRRWLLVGLDLGAASMLNAEFNGLPTREKRHVQLRETGEAATSRWRDGVDQDFSACDGAEPAGLRLNNSCELSAGGGVKVCRTTRRPSPSSTRSGLSTPF